MDDTLSRVIDIAEHVSGCTHLTGESAVDQDMRISGDDITWLSGEFAKEFGEDVWQWPWHRFVNLNEGLPLFFVPMLLWQLVSWPFRGTFEYPSSLERLELGHIANVIEAGHWIEP